MLIAACVSLILSILSTAFFDFLTTFAAKPKGIKLNISPASAGNPATKFDIMYSSLTRELTRSL